MDQSDGDRIKALLGKRNKADFARTAKIPGGPSMVSQHISGNRPVSIEAAIAYARGFGVPLGSVSPSAAQTVRSAAELLDKGPPPPSPTPGLKDAMPVLLEAIATAPAREKVRAALNALLDDDSPHYRQRLAELLGISEGDGRHAAGSSEKRLRRAA